ncbi:MAG: RluA family pseudouridine synthase [Clostridia bacterium]|nr:RluA family pseudouridine synthase [Clostridia bacterium]
MDYIIDRAHDRMTVKDYAKRVVGLSGAALKHLKFLPHGITVNGTRVTVRHLLSEGEVLSLAFEDTEPQEAVLPVSLPLAIAYEDETVVLPDKPAHMPTHPSFGHREDTVANALAFRYAKEGIPFVFRPVNRLDGNTSGLLLSARDRLTAARLSAAMREGAIHKQYIAVLKGCPEERQGTVDTYLRRTAESIIVREICAEGEGGDRAITRYRVLAESGGYSLCLASPVTGRTHQLRVHFAGLGCPIVGDTLYGSPSPLIDRHALHSAMLAFPHPKSGEACRVCAPLQEDMLALVRALFSPETLEAADRLCMEEGLCMLPKE